MASVGFSAEKEALVKEAWELMKPHVQELGIKMFSLIGEMMPEGRHMFYFLNDSNGAPHNNPQLRSHVKKVFTLTCESVVQLREKGKPVAAESTLKHLGSVHLKKGVQDPHFEVVKVAFMKVIQEAVGEKWSEEMGSAWAEAYDHLASAIKDKMKIQSTSV